MKKDKKISGVMVEQEMVKVDEVEYGCWRWILDFLLKYL